MQFLASCLAVLPLVLAQCPDYTDYSAVQHPPLSSGRYQLAYQRPSPECRSFTIPEVETAIQNISGQIADPDLARLFTNAFPNTLDTTVAWKGHAHNDTGEDLAFVITGDITAMWLRDSTNQMLSYASLLTPSNSPDSLASLYRGVLNLQARYIREAPFCNSFQPPVESGLAPSVNGAEGPDTWTVPSYSNDTIFECKYELDSLASFLELSSHYYAATQHIEYFTRHHWMSAVQTILNVTTTMMTPTYSSNGSVLTSPYKQGQLLNNGTGSPVRNDTGLVRSAFRPSDDSCMYQLFIPANMQFSHFLNETSAIMKQLNTSNSADLATQMATMASSIKSAIDNHGIVKSLDGPDIYAYEVDGYGSQNIMDDANVPSLLSLPFLGYLDASDPLYQATRSQLLSLRNPYWATGPVISAIGGPHDGPGHAWPMAAIIRAFTSTDDEEIADQIKMVLSSTDGLGLIHESINVYNATDYTRSWFAWANGLFGQLIVELASERPQLLQRSYQ